MRVAQKGSDHSAPTKVGRLLGKPIRTDFTELAWKKRREALITRRVVASNAVSEPGTSR